MSIYNTNYIIFIPSRDFSNLNELFINKQCVKSTTSYKRFLLSKKGCFEIDSDTVFDVSPIIENDSDILTFDGFTLFKQKMSHKRLKVQYIPPDVVEIRQEIRKLTFPNSQISLCIEKTKTGIHFEKNIVKCYLIVNKGHKNIDNKEISKYLALFN